MIKFLIAAILFLILDITAVVMIVAKQNLLAGSMTPFLVAAWVAMQKYSPS